MIMKERIKVSINRRINAFETEQENMIMNHDTNSYSNDNVSKIVRIIKTVARLRVQIKDLRRRLTHSLQPYDSADIRKRLDSVESNVILKGQQAVTIYDRVYSDIKQQLRRRDDDTMNSDKKRLDDIFNVIKDLRFRLVMRELIEKHPASKAASSPVPQDVDISPTSEMNGDPNI
jgi:hypothetical protein